MRHFFIRRIERNPAMYIGIPKERTYVVQLLAEELGLQRFELYVTLSYLKRHRPQSILAEDFGLNHSTVSRIIRKVVRLLSPILRYNVYWPGKDTIKANMPLTFLHNYSHVESIIDAFELKIQRPNKSVISQVSSRTTLMENPKSFKRYENYLFKS